jgi:hypothetical protein
MFEVSVAIAIAIAIAFAVAALWRASSIPRARLSIARRSSCIERGNPGAAQMGWPAATSIGALRACAAPVSLEAFHDSKRCPALLKIEQMHLAKLLIHPQLVREPPEPVRPRFEGVDGVAPHLSRDKRLERSMKSGFGIAQFGVRQPAQRHMAGASGEHPDPRVTGRALPYRAVVLPIGIGSLTESGERRSCAAIVANGFGKGFDGAADAHLQ